MWSSAFCHFNKMPEKEWCAMVYCVRGLNPWTLGPVSLRPSEAVWTLGPTALGLGWDWESWWGHMVEQSCSPMAARKDKREKGEAGTSPNFPEYACTDLLCVARFWILTARSVRNSSMDHQSIHQVNAFMIQPPFKVTPLTIATYRIKPTMNESWGEDMSLHMQAIIAGPPSASSTELH